MEWTSAPSARPSAKPRESEFTWKLPARSLPLRPPTADSEFTLLESLPVPFPFPLPTELLVAPSSTKASCAFTHLRDETCRFHSCQTT